MIASSKYLKVCCKRKQDSLARTRSSMFFLQGISERGPQTASSLQIRWIPHVTRTELWGKATVEHGGATGGPCGGNEPATGKGGLDKAAGTTWGQPGATSLPPARELQTSSRGQRGAKGGDEPATGEGPLANGASCIKVRTPPRQSCLVTSIV